MPGFNIPYESRSLDDVALPSAIIETARSNRWEVTIFTPLNDIILYAHKCTRPTPSIDFAVVHRGQNEAYFPGKHRWASVDFTFYDVLTSSVDRTAYLFYQWYTTGVLDIENSRIAGGINKYLVTYELLDGFGRNIYRYELINAFPIKVSPSNLDYKESSVADITVTLQYELAVES